MEKMSVLVSAYACRPKMGSEPGVGWNIVKELAQYCDIWVITRQDNKPFIESELINRPVDRLNFVYCDLPELVRQFKHRLNAIHFHYYLWQITAYQVAKELTSKIHFDLVHHITYVRYSTPSFVSFLSIPFIWGPVGGGESIPQAFWNDFHWSGKIYEILRSSLRWLGERDPFVAMTIKKSILINATTEETATRLKVLGGKNIQILSQVGLSIEEIKQLESLNASSNSGFKVVSVGRLLPWKGFHLGLKAFAQANLPFDAEYWIIGEGPERSYLQQLATELGISLSVKFWGNLPRNEAFERVSQCHVSMHPSLHESGGFVCLEAMAIGLPVLCLDLGGPAVHVTDKTGFKVPVINPDQAVRDLANALSLLSQNEDLRVQMGKEGQKRVSEHYSWNQKVKNFVEIYREIVDKVDQSTYQLGQRSKERNG